MIRIVWVGDGKMFTAEDPEKVVTQMCQQMNLEGLDLVDYMKQVARRVKTICNDHIIETDTPDNFLKSLRETGYIEIPQ